MSIETVSGPVKFVDSESLTVSTGTTSLTAAAYTKTTSGSQEVANVAYITTSDNPIYISFANSDHSTPGAASEGIYQSVAMPPFKIALDSLANVRLTRAGGTDAAVNVNYFVPVG